MGLGNLILIVIGVCVFLFSCYKIYKVPIWGISPRDVYFLIFCFGLVLLIVSTIEFIVEKVIPWLNQIKI